MSSGFIPELFQVYGHVDLASKYLIYICSILLHLVPAFPQFHAEYLVSLFS